MENLDLHRPDPRNIFLKYLPNSTITSQQLYNIKLLQGTGTAKIRTVNILKNIRFVFILFRILANLFTFVSILHILNKFITGTFENKIFLYEKFFRSQLTITFKLQRFNSISKHLAIQNELVF
jgi:hypothetical protein